MRATTLNIFLPLLAACLLLLSGCTIAQKSTPSKFYVLTAMPMSTEPLPVFENDPPNVGVSQVEIPGFLDRPQLTFRVNTNEVTYNEFARWAEPISAGVTRVVRQNLTELLGSGKVTSFPWMQPFPRKYMVSAVVTDFAAGKDNVAELCIIYRIADSKNQTTYMIQEACFKDSSGKSLTPDNAVVAMSDTLAQFSRAAAKDIAEVDQKVKAEAGK
ncbi:PqiC family protein [Cerasicoccus arenae]|uniref:ABC-type transport auxiliary lipoprotein component domain-containing protein n=1 Tax=Cerasicoccus arenae TaxID=424488 RepID=A0A8J3DBB5_9BACT|nr:PqiC family protein [Cerasicoccus arenae]MBK1857261.1 membrane integrity-associated transporter subunit PqiC [Cerasicoccus arenae]GHC00338.1 hypothetical protein GCM10007047_15800 [Cerasicoccus arenae]